MNQPLISVIVPIYNVEDYLDRCVESIVKQTYKHLEIILVDDGSPDNCPQICDGWAEKDSRIKVIHKENGGLSDARNAGLKITTGEIVSFIDSDDWIEMDNDGVLDTQSAMKELLNDGKLKQHVWNKIYKFDLIQDVPFEKGKYHEDVFWSYLIVGRAKRISVITDSFYNYVQRSNSIMGEGFSAKRLDALDANYLRCEYMKKHFPELYDHALYVYIGSCHYQLQCAVNSSQPKEVIDNIKNRTSYRKTGHPTRGISFKQKFWYYMFTFFPMTTCRVRNRLGKGI